MNNYSHQNTDLIKKTKSKIVGKLKIEVCPKCESLFITSRECEACGYQFAIDRLGEPYGEKSFYALKDSHFSSLPAPMRVWPSLEKYMTSKVRKYLFELKRRFQLLADAFENDPRPNSEYAVEVKDLVIELRDYGVKEDYFLNDSWGSTPLWFQMSISEGLNEYLWQKKSRDGARDSVSLYSHLKNSDLFPIAKWLVIYGLGVILAVYVARISYSF
jgi:hypothetical protein